MTTKFYEIGDVRPSFSCTGRNSWQRVQEWIYENETDEDPDFASEDDLDRVSIVESEYGDLVAFDGRIIGAVDAPISQSEIDAHLAETASAAE